MGGAIADAVAAKCELKKSVAAKVINEIAEIATAEVKKAGVFPLPGLCRIKTRMKPHQGRQEGDLRQDDHCQGQASQEDCQGVPSCGPEGQHLNAGHAAAIPSWDRPRDWH